MEEIKLNSKLEEKEILLRESKEALAEIVGKISDNDKYKEMAGFIQAIISELEDEEPEKEFLLSLVDKYSFSKGLGKVETGDKTTPLYQLEKLYDSLYRYIKKLK